MINMILMVGLMAAGAAPKPVMCTKAPPRSPSLTLVYNGKCLAGYSGIKDKDGKVMYCVNTKPAPPPVECKDIKLPPRK